MTHLKESTQRYILILLLLIQISRNRVQPSTEENVGFKLPFEAPSEEFCKTNSVWMGDNKYVSAFKPCVFVFYRKSNSTTGRTQIKDNFECSKFGLDDASVVCTKQRKVLGWPDACVAYGPRCYSLADFPNVQNVTVFGDSEDATEFADVVPSDVNRVSVDCSADYVEANAVHQTDNLSDSLASVFDAIIYNFLLFLVFVACSCLCCFCILKSRPTASEYQTVPLIATYQGRPVVARRQHSEDEKTEGATYQDSG